MTSCVRLLLPGVFFGKEAKRKRENVLLLLHGVLGASCGGGGVAI